MAAASESLLEVREIQVRYGRVAVIHSLSLRIDAGEIVAVLGPNGAGKTTLVRSILGLVPPSGGEIRFEGEPTSRLRAHEVAARGIAVVPEGRGIFPKMTVEENLILGSYLKRAKTRRKENLKRVYTLFPRLDERRHQLAETLSGGEQQMVAIGRGLMQKPQLVMFDEPSLGLAPILVHDIFKAIQELHREGLTIFLVEQNAHHALKIADYCYVIENGRVVNEGTATQLENDPSVREAYLGF